MGHGLAKLAMYQLSGPTNVHLACPPPLPLTDAMSHAMTPDKFNSQLRAMLGFSGSRGQAVPECLREIVKVCKWRSYLHQQLMGERAGKSLLR